MCKRFRASETCPLRNVGKIWWANFVINHGVRRKLLSSGIGSLEETLNVIRLEWLGHIYACPLNVSLVMRCSAGDLIVNRISGLTNQ